MMIRSICCTNQFLASNPSFASFVHILSYCREIGILLFRYHSLSLSPSYPLCLTLFDDIKGRPLCCYRLPVLLLCFGTRNFQSIGFISSDSSARNIGFPFAFFPFLINFDFKSALSIRGIFKISIKLASLEI